MAYTSHPIMGSFGYAHLPIDMRVVGERFHRLARYIDETLPTSAEKTIALRRLLTAQEHALRAWSFRDVTQPVMQDIEIADGSRSAVVTATVVASPAADDNRSASDGCRQPTDRPR